MSENKEYIERGAALGKCTRVFRGSTMLVATRDDINAIPAADVVEVVRCKDCRYALRCNDGSVKYCKRWEEQYGVSEQLYHDANNFCSFGELKDGDAHDSTEDWPDWKKRAALSNYEVGKDDAHGYCVKRGMKRPLMYDLGYGNNNCIGCVKGGMGYFNKIRRDFPDVFAARAAMERDIGASCINGVFLDELDPLRGRDCIEIVPECSIYCEIAAIAEKGE